MRGYVGTGIEDGPVWLPFHVGTLPEVQRMSSETRNHSFSLQPKASDIVNSVKDQKKSGYVSDAIVFYWEKSQEGAQFLRTGEISNDEAKHVLPMGGWRGIFHAIRSFWL
jgi:hypothetical protein